MKTSYILVVMVAILLITRTMQWGYDEDEKVDETTADVKASVDERASLICTSNGKPITSVTWKNTDGFSLAEMKDNKTNIPRRDKYELKTTSNYSEFTIKSIEVKNQGCYTCEIVGEDGSETTCKKCLYVNTHVSYVWYNVENSSVITCFVGSKQHKQPSWRVSGIVITGSTPYSMPKGYTRGTDDYGYSMITITNTTDSVEKPYCRYWLNDTHSREYPVDFKKDLQDTEHILTNFKVVYGRW
ncbi:hypothetical protein [Fowlpox virus]|nr:hypothetical protein [Fowlpox virus]